MNGLIQQLHAHWKDNGLEYFHFDESKNAICVLFPSSTEDSIEIWFYINQDLSISIRSNVCTISNGNIDSMFLYCTVFNSNLEWGTVSFIQEHMTFMLSRDEFYNPETFLTDMDYMLANMIEETETIRDSINVVSNLKK